MGLEKYFIKGSFDVDWEMFWRDVKKDYNSDAYKIHQVNAFKR